MMKNLLLNVFFVLIASVSSGGFFSFHVYQYFSMPNGYLC